MFKQKKKKKKKKRLTPNSEVCYASIRFFQALNVVLESGYSGHSLHIDIQHCFSLRQLKKKMESQPTNRYAI